MTRKVWKMEIEELEDVDSFVYLGAKVTTSGGADDDIYHMRLGEARATFGKLMNIWRSSQLGKSTEIRIFKSNAIAVMLYMYGCESWRMTKGDEAKIELSSTSACVGFASVK